MTALEGFWPMLDDSALYSFDWFCWARADGIFWKEAVIMNELGSTCY